jgi:hypothetical protein
LKDNDVSVNFTDVLAIQTESTADSIARPLAYFTQSGISI